MPTGRRGIRYVNKNHELLRGCAGWWKVLPWNAGGAYLVNVLSPGQLLGTRSSTGTAWQGIGPPGMPGSLNFDGSSGTVDTTASASFPTADITVAMWFNSTFAPTGTVLLVGNWRTGAANNYGLFWSDSGGAGAGKLEFLAGNGGTACNVANTWNDGNWHHVVARGIASSNNKTIWIDGVIQIDSTPGGSYTVSNPTSAWQIGAGNAQWFWGGNTDGFLLYNRAISSAEVYDLYRETRAGCPNLIPRRRASVIVPGGAPTAQVWMYQDTELNGGFCDMDMGVM